VSLVSSLTRGKKIARFTTGIIVIVPASVDDGKCDRAQLQDLFQHSLAVKQLQQFSLKVVL